MFMGTMRFNRVLSVIGALAVAFTVVVAVFAYLIDKHREHAAISQILNEGGVQMATIDEMRKVYNVIIPSLIEIHREMFDKSAGGQKEHVYLLGVNNKRIHSWNALIHAYQLTGDKRAETYLENHINSDSAFSDELQNAASRFPGAKKRKGRKLVAGRIEG